MSEPADTAAPASGIAALCVDATAHNLAVDPHRLIHALGLAGRPVAEADIILAARQLGLKARAGTGTWSRLPATALPAIAQRKDGEFMVILQCIDDQAVVYDPVKSARSRLDEAALAAVWTGRLILLKPQFALGNPARPFDLFWFLPVVLRYRAILVEVLLAALFVQVFAVVTPLFSQVIFDKVLMHKSLATLHVPGFGMAAVIVFDTVLGVVQTHLMSHTANRIDVTLGARLVRHLLRLPLKYFEARQVGETAARVREMDNIRQFLTGGAITVVLDLLFVFVFLALMVHYSATLTAVVLAALPLLAGC